MIILVGIIVLLTLLVRITVAYIILSWLQAFGLPIRIQFLDDIIQPLFTKIESVLPTNFGPFSFTAIILILLIGFIKGLLYIFFPELPGLVPTTFR